MLWWVMPDGGVFGALFRMFLYHWAHPLQYIALMSLCYTLVACLVILSPNNPVGRRPRLVIPFIMAASIIVASPAGGVLWVFHDMQAGYFPEGRRFWEAIRWGAVEGIRSGWLIILSSIPYNILGVVAGYWVTWGGYTMAHPALERH